MILVNKNLSYIQQAELDNSCIGKIKYSIGGRITSLGTALALLAEAVSRIALSLLAIIGQLISFGFWQNRALVTEQTEKAKGALFTSWDCFMAVFSPHSLQDRLTKGPLAAEVRENRIRLGADLIERKLEKEFRCAQNQMLNEEDGENFHYVDGDLGVVGAERVSGYDIGFCHYIGRRLSMEDEHLATAFDLHVNKLRYPVSLFGIFDGHGGPEAAKFLKDHLKDKLQQTLIEMNPNGLTDEGIWNALKLTFVRLNQEFPGESGSTATVSLILDGKLWVANVGDSRTILVNGEEVMQLSEDANPTNPRYRQGIENRGGRVWWHDGMRVNGDVAVARSVGDHHLNGAISARPKVTMIPLAQIRPGSRLIKACDGVYDVASSRQIGSDHAREAPEIKARKIVNSAFQAESTDNLSAMVIQF